MNGVDIPSMTPSGSTVELAHSHGESQKVWITHKQWQSGRMRGCGGLGCNSCEIRFDGADQEAAQRLELGGLESRLSRVSLTKERGCHDASLEVSADSRADARQQRVSEGLGEGHRGVEDSAITDSTSSDSRAR